MKVFKKDTSIDEVTKLAESDPAIKSGVMDFEIKTWMRVFGK